MYIHMAGMHRVGSYRGGLVQPCSTYIQYSWEGGVNYCTINVALQILIRSAKFEGILIPLFCLVVTLPK